MIGDFATDSAAIGLFVVLTSDQTGDEFRALLREGQGDSAITVPPSTYTLLVYDLEDNALPNENPAFTSSEKITVKNGKRVVMIRALSVHAMHIIFSLQSIKTQILLLNSLKELVYPSVDQQFRLHVNCQRTIQRPPVSWSIEGMVTQLW